MRIKETEVYQFEELSDAAKERARDWYRQGFYDNYWSESVIEDASTIAGILGIDLKTYPVKLMGGSTRYDPLIYWQLDCQGAGACFSGRYSHVKGMRHKLAAHIGSESKGDKTLHAIAKELITAQKACGYRAVIDITANDRSMTVSCEDVSDKALNDVVYERIESALQDFAHWIYMQLRNEWEYQNSDKCVDENIKANEYEFDMGGRRV